ncbi:hypothetical protein ACI68E_002293 [Malassezia pachydermatis]|uniref:Uncharacterized protein n=1 Tax=Malassezia pachydermatis TaxID=77020 RepID=A0A0M8MMM4_9BASI|nr:hypothetical protein Malapachy_0889 [Malassezia pachydermatis]KOS14628.1 hypothetical protein Malapachy_0889 [Malassezia pachydermatis]
MDFFFPTSYAPTHPTYSAWGCGPSVFSSPVAYDMFDLGQAMMEAEWLEHRRAAVRMQQFVRRRQQQHALESMMQQLAMENARQAAIHEAHERRMAKARAQRAAEALRKRAVKAAEAEDTDNSDVVLQLGPWLVRLPLSNLPSSSDSKDVEDTEPAEKDLAPLTGDTNETIHDETPTPAPEEPVSAPTSASSPVPVPAPTASEPVKERVSPSDPVNEALPTSDDLSQDADTEEEEEPATDKAANPTTSHDTKSQLLFSYDFPSADTPYGLEVRKLAQADRISVEASPLNGGSIKISGLWSPTAPTSQRVSSPRSPHVRDCDEDGNEVLLPEDSESESESVSERDLFTESAILPLPRMNLVQGVRAELNDDGFRLYID